MLAGLLFSECVLTRQKEVSLIRALLFVVLVLLGAVLLAQPPAGATREDFEPLIVGKEGLNFEERSLYRGRGDIEVVRIEGDSLHRWFIPRAAGDGPVLVPEFSGTEQVIEAFKEFNSEVEIELLYQMPLPDVPAGKDPRLHLLQQLSDWKSMEGIQYFSTSIGRMTTYLREVEVVQEPGSFAGANFIVPESLPRQPIRFHIRQLDNKFAPVWYQFDLSVVGDEAILLEFTNSTTLQIPFLFFRFKVLDAGDMIHRVYFILSDDRLEIYALSLLRNTITEILGRKLDLANSFDRRMSAIQSWISSRLYD